MILPACWFLNSTDFLNYHTDIAICSQLLQLKPFLVSFLCPTNASNFFDEQEQIVKTPPSLVDKSIYILSDNLHSLHLQGCTAFHPSEMAK